MQATIVGYTRGAVEICRSCATGYIETAIDGRINDLDDLARLHGWPLHEHDRHEIRSDLLEQELEPIVSTKVADRYPICDVCGFKITDVLLSAEGLAYERRQEYAHLDQEEDRRVFTPEQQAYLDEQPERLAKRGLKFGVIYSLDLAYTNASWLHCYQPWPNEYPRPHQVVEGVMRGVWTKAEGDDSFEYDHLEGDWVGGIHRKYVACLDKDQFRAFMDHTSLRFGTENTMGSLGGPTPDEPSGGFSAQPAISFDDDGTEGGVILNAYVTPFWIGDHLPDDEDWDRIVEVLRREYS